MCHDFLKDISWTNTTSREKGQANEEVCIVLFVQLQQNAVTVDRYLKCINLKYILSDMFQLEWAIFRKIYVQMNSGCWYEKHTSLKHYAM